ncbi:hypothetical protein IWQ60_007161 [Tieghemiomyces parasiticus]|uniref:Uncharacterized protein n=1 Tax=Tieghemiomyces parasiticus TaxID=78921 RepID=A0A9W8DRG7_9FUNG|nr:hypothetical protein IWQ60_007161 [Tieghemiomyces parasiticus]
MSFLNRLRSAIGDPSEATAGPVTGLTSRLGSTSAYSPSGFSPATAGLGSSSVGRRFSVYGTEDRVVLDIGSHALRCGFSGEPHPRQVIPLYHDLRWNPRPALPFTADPQTARAAAAVVASEVFDQRRETGQALYSLRIHELDPGRLRHLLAHYLRRVFSEVLMTDPKLRKVLICDAPLCPLPLKRAVAEVLFAQFEVSALVYFPTPSLALLTAGTTNGLVIDCGHLETTVVPVFESHALIHHTRTTPVAGRALGIHLQDLLLAHTTLTALPAAGTDIDSALTPALPSLEEVLTEAVVEDIKTRLLFASPVHAGFVETNPSADDRTRWYRDTTTAADTTYTLTHPSPKDSTSTTLPRRRYALVVPGWIRERAAEILFRGNEEQDMAGIPNTILDALLRAPIDLRQLLSTSLLIVGGTAMLPNFAARLHLELQHLLLHQPRYRSALRHLTEHLEFLDDKTNGQLFSRNLRVWVGGKFLFFC